MTLSVIIDIVVIAFLVPTIAIAVLLNRRLSALRSNKAELDALIQSFNDACARAEAGVRTLRSATDEANRLQNYLDRSQNLRDDLAYLIDRGSSLADRLEGNVRTARTEVPRGQLGSLAAAVGALGDGEGRPAARPVPAAEVASNGAEAPAARPGRPERPQRDRGTRAAAGAAAAAPAPGIEPAAPVPTTPGEATPRSKAERELLQALRSRR